MEIAKCGEQKLRKAETEAVGFCSAVGSHV